MAQAATTIQKSQVIEVTAADLPVSCPQAGTLSAAQHPRVYIPVRESGGAATCPYCGAEYRLADS